MMKRPSSNGLNKLKTAALLISMTVVCSAFWPFSQSTPKDEEKAEAPATTPDLKSQDVSKEKKEELIEKRNVLSKELGPSINAGKFLEKTEIEWKGKTTKVLVNYTLDSELQRNAENLLRSYKPDYGAILVMDPTTGKVLAMTSFERDPEIKTNLNLIATFPAASIFKMVTATAAIDKYNLGVDTVIPFNGGNYTLYKKNVLSDKITRWTKEITFKQAFARSINTVFGKISLNYLEPHDLADYANKYQFAQELNADFPVQKSWVEVPDEKSFELAEVASGYNKHNTLSPVQGAMMAGSVVEDGIMRAPFIVESMSDEAGNVLYKAEPMVLSVTMNKESGPKMRQLMEETIVAGTSRKNFRKLVKDKKFKYLEMGGKTGHLTGSNPKGRVDWFVGYAFLDNQKISIAAITVNKKNWRVKSTYLAQSLVKSHFKEYLQEIQRDLSSSKD